MRRFLTGCAMAAILAAVPSWAVASNQAVAEQIAQNLRQSGQISDYKIGVKYQDGTAWLRGRVNDEEQMEAALRTAQRTPGVKRIVNELSIASEEASAPVMIKAKAKPMAPKKVKTAVASRLESSVTREESEDAVERVPSSYAARSAQRTSMQEASDVVPQRMAAPPRARPMSMDRVAMQDVVHGPTPVNGNPMPMYAAGANPAGVAPSRYDQPCMPNYAWPSYASYPNYAAVTYPKQYSPTAWPYIGPFYPYPQVPLGWRKVTLEWDDGWWFLDFKDQPSSAWHR